MRTAIAVFVAMAALPLVPLSGEAQQTQRVARVGFLTSNGRASTTTQDNLRDFLERMRELGWAEGTNLLIEARYAEWQYDRLPKLAEELVKTPVDVIFANAAPSAMAAKRATTSVPIVFETLGDPVTIGLVSSLSKPGSNVTGISGLSPELSASACRFSRRRCRDWRASSSSPIHATR